MSCDDKRMENKEKKRLTNIFMNNGYPRLKIQETLKKKHHRKDQPRNEEIKTLVLPYTPRLSEDIEVSCRNLPLRIAFTSFGTLGNALTKVKTPTPPFEKTGVIYAVHCECGGTYIGETGRTFKIRMSKHKRAIKNGIIIMLYLYMFILQVMPFYGTNVKSLELNQRSYINKKYTQHRSWSTHQPFLEHCLTITVLICTMIVKPCYFLYHHCLHVSYICTVTSHLSIYK